MAPWFSVGLPVTFCGNPVEPRWSERSLDDLSVDELGVSRRYSSLRLTICTVACSPKPLARPVGRSNWLFAGSLRSGKRAAAIMSLIQPARMNGHDPYAYLTDVLTRLPTQKASALAELLPHNWVSSGKV